MKKLLSLLACVVLALTATGCSTRIGPGHVGIVVQASGTDKGVLDAPVRTGRVFYNPFYESIIEYPTFVQTVVWTKSTSEGNPVDESITFTNKDSMSINMDVSLSYSLLGDKVPAFYVKFLTADLTAFTNGFMRNVARDCINERGGSYEIAQLMGDNADFIKTSRACVDAQLLPYGVHIEQFGIIGAPRPPDNVLQQINSKNQAQQMNLQKQMELAGVQAEAAKNVAQAEGNAKAQIAAANGDAEANKIRSASITPMIIRSKELENQHDMIFRWHGDPPHTIVGDVKSGMMLPLPN